MLDAAVVLLGKARHSGTLILTGCSMLPTLRPGQRLYVKFGAGRLRVGDLVLFRQDDYLVVHRLVASGSDSGGFCRLRSRGDGVPRLDPELDPSSILGRVVAVDDAHGKLDLETRAARSYAWGVACHSRLWAGLGWLALVADRVVAKIGLVGRFRLMTAALDRLVLRTAHRLLFRRVHGSMYKERLGPTAERLG
jgi:hypothetical protein